MSSPPTKEQSHQQLNRELRDAISILTGLGKTRNGDSDDALGIITVAGTNKGAVMKMEGPEAAIDQISAAVNRNGREGTEAIANSNYQSMNNSIVIGGSCGAEDPGVHLLVQDYVEGDEGDDEHHEAKSEEKKKKKKKKETSEEEKQHAEAKNEE
ncbi:uncharacterized protein LOC110032191 [Phalaenopsis equestris]|uniref:uncharacterized protein LOC110032191 n=1 Tax=Phalaenopsis equestris TaxID=78828 RepID=UPI0009E52F2E|nr:uncharacterized protein LOC110032191 [Phalaenopsis equestris]